jgi:membrane protease YdiL (CAAX protease family)
MRRIRADHGMAAGPRRRAGIVPRVRLDPVPRARPAITWGIGDVLAAWGVGFLASLVAAAFVLDARRPVQLLVLLVAQDGAMVGWLMLVSRRKGLGSLRADFGFRLVPRTGSPAGAVPWFFAGLGLQVVALVPVALLVAIHGSDAKQDVVRVADQSTGLEVPLVILAVAVLAPVAEELLFRGALLRSLMRRTDPGRAVLVSALVFGGVHVIGDPSVGSLIALPVIVLLGLVCGYQAVKTGDLCRSIMLHIGFNTLSAVLLFA